MESKSSGGKENGVMVWYGIVGRESRFGGRFIYSEGD